MNHEIPNEICLKQIISSFITEKLDANALLVELAIRHPRVFLSLYNSEDVQWSVTPNDLLKTVFVIRHIHSGFIHGIYRAIQSAQKGQPDLFTEEGVFKEGNWEYEMLEIQVQE